jgi:NAD(P)-dependent dehydrogenase (short-subunit alcohol dehydrogenase family)
MDELQGKVAVITGGASGIGLATAKRLAREGMRLVLADIEPPALEKAAQELRALGAEVLPVPTDVGERAQVEQLADLTFERLGGAHVLFNNAGVAIFGGIETMRHDDWEWLMRVNLWGVIHGVESFVPRMIQQGVGGHIVSTASFAGLVPNQGLIVYCTTKYAVVGLSEVLYRDLSQYGIGVSVLCPMVVETNINTGERNRPPELGGGQSTPVPAEEGASPRALFGGVLKAEDVAEQVLDGIRENRLYILTHEESRAPIQRRFARIDRTFES